MSEEEKKAIENANKLINFDTLLKGWQCDGYGDTFSKEQMKAILKLIDKQQNQLEEKTYLYNKLETESKCLIEKQQKEIEQLANGIRVLGTNPDITTEEIIKEFTEKPISEEYMEKFKSGYISKDEVLKALGYEENGEEYKRIYNKEEMILTLIHLINAECDRLEDIEDRKTMVEVNHIEDMRDKYWQDKINDKIKEIISSPTYRYCGTEWQEDEVVSMLEELSEEKNL